MQLVTKPIGCTATLLEHTFLSPAQLAQDEQSRRPQAHRSEALRIGPKCVGQHQGLTPVILGAGDGVAVPKAIKLCGIDRKHLRTPARVTSLPMAPRGTAMATATWLGAPPDTSRHQDATVPDWFHHAGPHAHRHGGVVGRGEPLVVLVAPINPHKPLVRDARLLRQTGRLGGRDGCDHPALLLSLGAPMVSAQPCTGAHGATSSKRCTTGVPLGCKSSSGARSAGRGGHAQRGPPCTGVRIAVQGSNEHDARFPCL